MQSDPNIFIDLFTAAEMIGAAEVEETLERESDFWSEELPAGSKNL